MTFEKYNPYAYLIKHNPPTPKKIQEYLKDLRSWNLAVSSNPSIQKVEGIGNAHKVKKFYRYQFLHKTFDPDFEKFGSLDELPQVKDFKRVRFITNPYHLPDIGGKDGKLTKYLRSLPLGTGECYPTAFAIAAKFPEVNIVFGMYPNSVNIPNSNLSKITGLSKLQAEKVLKESKELQKSARDRMKHIGGNWYHDGEDLFLWHRDALWTWHAWNEYKGKHFDLYLWKIEKELPHQPTWFSKNNDKFIIWKHYIEYKRCSISHYSQKERDAVEIGAIDFMVQLTLSRLGVWLLRKITFGNNIPMQAYSDFPSYIPSNRKWMKDKKPRP